MMGRFVFPQSCTSADSGGIIRDHTAHRTSRWPGALGMLRCARCAYGFR